MPKRSVLHVTQAIGDVSQTVGGVAVVMLDYVAALVAAGDDVTVACPDLGNMPEEVRARGARFLEWRSQRDPGLSAVTEARALKRVVAAARPDVVHLHSSKAGLVGRAVLRGRTPTLFSPHAWSFLHGDSAVMRRAAASWEAFAARWTDVIVCVSEAERAAGRAAGISARYEVLSNTVELPQPDTDRGAARSALLPQVARDAPVVLCIGRMTHQKGQDILLRAWPRVRRECPDARLVLVGSGPEEERIRAAAPNDVILVPAVPHDEVSLWTIAADVVAFPSRWEGQSIGVLESLQLGRPVVVSDCEGMAEALEGGRGELVPVEDEAALSAALIGYVTDLPRAHAEGKEAAIRYREVHGRRRRENLGKYTRLIAELSQRARP